MEIETVITGTKWRGPRALEAIAKMRVGDTIKLEREAGNRHDVWAVSCHYWGMHVGYIPRQANGPIAKALDAGAITTAIVAAPAQVSATGYVAREPSLCVRIDGEPQL